MHKTLPRVFDKNGNFVVHSPHSTASPPEKATYRGGFFGFLAILRPLWQHKFVSLSILSSASRPTHLLFATGSERSLSLLVCTR